MGLWGCTCVDTGWVRLRAAAAPEVRGRGWAVLGLGLALYVYRGLPDLPRRVGDAPNRTFEPQPGYVVVALWGGSGVLAVDVKALVWRRAASRLARGLLGNGGLFRSSASSLHVRFWALDLTGEGRVGKCNRKPRQPHLIHPQARDCRLNKWREKMQISVWI